MHTSCEINNRLFLLVHVLTFAYLRSANTLEADVCENYYKLNLYLTENTLRLNY